MQETENRETENQKSKKQKQKFENGKIRTELKNRITGIGKIQDLKKWI